MFVQRVEVAITADGSGNGTGFADPGTSGGFVHAIRYLKDGTSPYTDGAVDFTFTGEVTGLAVLTVTNQTGSATYYPRAGTVDVTNAASLYAAAGTAVNDRIPIGGERLKIGIAQAGAATVGKFEVWFA